MRTLLYVFVYFNLPVIRRCECWNFSAVTLLFILLTSSLFTWDSFLSVCQSPMPSHFCTDDVTQSAEDEGQLCKDFVSHITKWIFKCLYLCRLNAIDIFHFSCELLLMRWFHYQYMYVCVYIHSVYMYTHIDTHEENYLSSFIFMFICSLLAVSWGSFLLQSINGSTSSPSWNLPFHSTVLENLHIAPLSINFIHIRETAFFQKKILRQRLLSQANVAFWK